jgi:Uma2 family endonuclease
MATPIPHASPGINQQPVRWPLTVAAYHRLGELNFFANTERTELVNGEIFRMAPIGSRHAYVVDRLNRNLSKQTNDQRLIRVQNPILLGPYGEPQPDLTVVKNKDYFTALPGPDDVLLLIEVAEHSLEYDLNTKLPQYAEHGIPEVWIVNVVERSVTQYREPQSETQRFQFEERITAGELRSSSLPEVVIRLGDLFSSG